MTCGKPHAEYVGQLQFTTQLAGGQMDAAPRCRNPKCNLPLKKDGTCPRGCRQEDNPERPAWVATAAAVVPCNCGDPDCRNLCALTPQADQPEMVQVRVGRVGQDRAEVELAVDQAGLTQLLAQVEAARYMTRCGPDEAGAASYTLSGRMVIDQSEPESLRFLSLSWHDAASGGAAELNGEDRPGNRGVLLYLHEPELAAFSAQLRAYLGLGPGRPWIDQWEAVPPGRRCPRCQQELIAANGTCSNWHCDYADPYTVGGAIQQGLRELTGKRFAVHVGLAPAGRPALVIEGEDRRDLTGDERLTLQTWGFAVPETGPVAVTPQLERAGEAFIGGWKRWGQRMPAVMAYNEFTLLNSRFQEVAAPTGTLSPEQVRSHVLPLWQAAWTLVAEHATILERSEGEIVTQALHECAQHLRRVAPEDLPAVLSEVLNPADAEFVRDNPALYRWAVQPYANQNRLPALPSVVQTTHEVQQAVGLLNDLHAHEPAEWDVVAVVQAGQALKRMADLQVGGAGPAIVDTEFARQSYRRAWVRFGDNAAAAAALARAATAAGLDYATAATRSELLAYLDAVLGSAEDRAGIAQEVAHRGRAANTSG